MSHCCPISWRSCCFGSAESSPSHAPADHRWSGCWGGPTQSPGFDPGWWQGWSACQFSLILTTMMSSPELPWLAHPVQQGTTGSMGSPAFTPLGTAHPYLHHLGQFYWAAQVQQGAGSSFLNAATGDGQEQFFYSHDPTPTHHSWQGTGRRYNSHSPTPPYGSCRG